MLRRDYPRIDAVRQFLTLSGPAAAGFDPHPVAVPYPMAFSGRGMDFGDRMPVHLAQFLDLPMLRIEEAGDAGAGREARSTLQGAEPNCSA